MGSKRAPQVRSRCPDAQAQLPAYVEGELSPGERSRIAGHLEICAACRREESEFRRSLGALRSPHLAEPPRDLYAGFAAKLARAEGSGGRLALQLRLAAAGCILLAAAVVASPLRTLLFETTAVPVSRDAARRAPRWAAATLPATKQQIARGAEAAALPDASSTGGVPPAPEIEAPKAAAKAAGSSHALMAGPRIVRHERGRRRPLSFLDVRPRIGPSAHERLDEVSRLAMRVPAPASPPRPRMPEDESVSPHPPGSAIAALPASDALIAVRSQRVQVGDKVMEIRTAYRPDRSGRPAAVKVDISATGTAEEVSQ